MAIIPERERERIVAIAREVRRHVRVGAGAYCPPEGLCGEAALALSVRLTRAGIPHRPMAGTWQGPITVRERPEMIRKKAREDPHFVERMHAWIEFPQYDGAILDVTADQYHKVPGIWFPARRDWYEPIEAFDPQQLVWEQESLTEKERGVPLIPLVGPRFRRPLKAAKVRVRNHLRHPPASCLCHKSKTVDRVRRKLVRRLK